MNLADRREGADDGSVRRVNENERYGTTFVCLMTSSPLAGILRRDSGVPPAGRRE